MGISTKFFLWKWIEINDPYSWINNLSGWKELEKIHAWLGLNLDLSDDWTQRSIH